MKTTMMIAATLLLLTGCELNDFYQKQRAWNAANGMGSMNAGVDIPGGSSFSSSVKTTSTDSSEPSLDSMHCTSTSVVTQTVNAGSGTSSSSCHN